MPKRRAPEIETLQVPHEYVALADRRIAAIVRRCCYDDNIIESIARSCYLQGVVDGAQAAASRPDVVQQIQQVQPVQPVQQLQGDRDAEET
jgi:hypothetical protein